jgi:hypothetical protein
MGETATERGKRGEGGTKPWQSCGIFRCIPAKLRVSLAPAERQEVGLDRLRFRRRHAVREAFVGFPRAVLQKLGDIGPEAT